MSFEMRNCLLSTFSRSKQPAACNRNSPPDTFSMGDALLFLSPRAPSLYFNPVHDARRILQDPYGKKDLGQKRKFVKCNKDEEHPFARLEKGILCFLKRKRSKNSILFLISRWNNFKVYIFGNKSEISKVNLLRKQGYCVGSNFFCFPKRKEGIIIQ